MQNRSFLDLIQERTVIFDGAMGTMLFKAGLPPGGIPELWNLEKPDIVLDVYKQYYEAGSDVVHSNTFGGSAIKLSHKGHADKMEALNKAAVQLAKQVCPAEGFVAGDIGPTGKMLQPIGDAVPEELEEAFFHQATALLKGGADLISIETMFSLEEALAAVRGAKRAGNCPVLAGVTFNRTPDGFFTMMGESVAQSASAFENEDVDVITSNCTLGSRDMVELAKIMRASTKKPLLLQPNAGKPVQQDDGTTVYQQTAAEFAQDIEKIIAAGIDMVGGCCGTDAAFIREIAQFKQ
jgi:5-methyltetrahydrofolate--homocysteine methyltransferase